MCRNKTIMKIVHRKKRRRALAKAKAAKLAGTAAKK